jgi:hypothetical protein
MSAETALSPRLAVPQPGTVYWHVFGNGVRGVVLRRFTSSGLARVSRSARFGRWKSGEIKVELSDLFFEQEDALAWFRRRRDQPRRVASRDGAA